MRVSIVAFVALALAAALSTAVSALPLPGGATTAGATTAGASNGGKTTTTSKPAEPNENKQDRQCVVIPGYGSFCD
ncbi:hypothetical protein DFJ73DRAFT_845229 [Zopfochytrium polystomum]|nr:hypothetical protein DFJ73DRAFT_845229 [Zopfochytrium polystomum]